MTYTPTNRPVPSDAPEDLYFNSSTLDSLVTGPATPVVDRTGVERKSWAQIEAEAAALVGLPADLANGTDPTKGAALVGGALSSQVSIDGATRKVPVVGSYVNYELGSQKRTNPPGFSWLPFQFLGFNVSGKAVVSKTALQIAKAIGTLPNTGTNRVTVDPSVGTDTPPVFNSRASTVATIPYALARDSDIVEVAPGVYPPFQLRSDTPTHGRLKRIIGSGDPKKDWADPTKLTIIRVAGDTAASLTWTLDSGTMRATVVTSNLITTVTYAKLRDEFGRPLPLQKQTSIANVASLGGWYFDSATKNIYVRHGATASFDAQVKPSLDLIYSEVGSSTMRVQGREGYYENILFIGCQILITQGSGLPSTAVFKNCAFWYSNGSGLAVDGSYAVLDDCEIYRAFGDGVGTHASPQTLAGVQATHVAINTDANYSGNFDANGSGANNQNGFSAHENCRSVILGGNIRKSCGPNLIDTGLGTGSVGSSWWAGVHAEDSLGANPTNYETYGVRTVWMESCTERGDAGVPVRVAEVGTVLRHVNNGVRGVTPELSGVAVQYDPKQPQ